MSFINAHLSVSRLTTYAECPRRFYHRYVAKTPLKDQVMESETPAAFGKAVHAVLESTYGWVAAEKYEGPYPEDRIVPAWQRAFNDVELVHPDIYQEGLRVLRLYAKRHPTVDHSRILGIEKEIDLQVEGFRVTGYIDRIDRKAEDHVEVVDYKTSLRPYTGEELSDSLQMSVYGAAVREEMPHVKTVTFSFDMVRLGYEQRTTRTIEQLDDARAYVAMLGRRTESDQEFSPKLNKNCSYCEYRTSCDAYKNALAKTHPKVKDLSDLDAVAKEYSHVSYVANAAYARKRELETILKSEVFLSWDSPVLDGKRWDLYVQPQTEYDLEKIVRILGEHRVPKEVYRELFAVASASKDSMTKEFFAKIESTMGRSDFLLLKKEIEVLGLSEKKPKVSLRSKAVGK